VNLKFARRVTLLDKVHYYANQWSRCKIYV